MRARISTVAVVLAFCLPAATAAADGGPIMPLSDVHAGMDCIGETVVQGTTISTFGVHVINVVQQPGQGPRILISASGAAVTPSGIAEGFSGSPVYCPDADGNMLNAGAISAGVGEFGNKVGLVTPIEQMLGEPVLPPSSAPRFTARARPLLGPLMVGGLSDSWMRLLQRAGSRAGRSVVTAPSSATLEFPVQQLVPGASVAAAYSSGAIPVGAVGTVTYRDGQNVYAFGHELDGAGRRSLLLQDAYVYYVVNNPNPGQGTSYKLAVAGHTVGTLTSDTPNAVIGQVGAPPARTPVDVTARDDDTGKTLSMHSDVAGETDIGLPLGSSLVGLIAPLEVGQAATQIYNGAPASESGRMCLEVTIRESSVPLHFCNRYVGTGAPGDQGDTPPELALSAGTDVASALALIDAVQFAPLHLTRVSARIDAQRGLREGNIVGEHAPHRVRPGQDVAVALRVRVVRGRLETIHVKLRIPRGAHGNVAATISNATAPPPGESPSQQLADALAQALGGGSGVGSGPPDSVSALRSAFDATAVYDGLVVRFKGHQPTHAYDNPNLLVQGTATLSFRVAR